MHNMAMGDTTNRARSQGTGRFRQPQRVQFSRGHWLSEGEAGAVRSAGWWESVTVTWSPPAAPERRPALLQRALASAVDLIAPSIAELVAVSAKRVLERQYRARRIPPSSRRVLRSVARELPPADRTS
jgi:hypothetical protein